MRQKTSQLSISKNDWIYKIFLCTLFVFALFNLSLLPLTEIEFSYEQKMVSNEQKLASFNDPDEIFRKQVERKIDGNCPLCKVNL